MSTTSTQPVTAELRRWIIAQAEAGCRPEDVVAAMVKSGWDEDVALDALEGTLRARLDAVAAQRGSLPPPVPVPQPALAGAPPVVSAGGRDVSILMSMALPRVIVF